MFGKISKNNSSIYQQHQPEQQQQQSMFMGFHRKPLPMSLPMLKHKSAATMSNQYAPSDGNKMRWGKPTWHFFHTLAYKIKPESFTLIREQTLQIIMHICASLPCPMCSSHATEYLKKVNFNAIRTKEDLIDMFYVFHNTVNARKNFKLFAKDDMHSVYANASPIDAYNNFMRFYIDKQKGFRLMADNMVRSQNLQMIKNWFQSLQPHLSN